MRIKRFFPFFFGGGAVIVRFSWLTKGFGALVSEGFLRTSRGGQRLGRIFTIFSWIFDLPWNIDRFYQ